MKHELWERYPALKVCEQSLDAAVQALIACFENDGKLLLCGNGGSCTDCEHIVGELMKGFLKMRPLNADTRKAMTDRCGEVAPMLDRLQGGLPAISLPSFTALNSAFCNDVDPELMYAQSLMGLGRRGDILLALSTSGNSKNVVAAVKVAKSLGLMVIGLTGQSGGAIKALADITICVPETETFKVQELHLPVYHYLCAAVEQHFFRT